MCRRPRRLLRRILTFCTNRINTYVFLDLVSLLIYRTLYIAVDDFFRPALLLDHFFFRGFELKSEYFYRRQKNAGKQLIFIFLGIKTDFFFHFYPYHCFFSGRRGNYIGIVHILRTPKGGVSRNTTLGLGGRGVKAWVRSIFIIAFLLHFGGFNGVCASERNATHLHFSLALNLATMKPASVRLSSPLSYPRVKVVTIAALPSRTLLSVFSSTVYFVQFVEFCFI